MRFHIRSGVGPAPSPALLPVQDDETPRIVALAMTAQGSATAAWIIRKHHASFRQFGAMEYKVPRAFLLSLKLREEKLRWFYVAIARLRRSEKWSVTRSERDGQIVYLIRWELRGAYSRKGAP